MFFLFNLIRSNKLEKTSDSKHDLDIKPTEKGNLEGLKSLFFLPNGRLRVNNSMKPLSGKEVRKLFFENIMKIFLTGLPRDRIIGKTWS